MILTVHYAQEMYGLSGQGVVDYSYTTFEEDEVVASAISVDNVIGERLQFYVFVSFCFSPSHY